MTVQPGNYNITLQRRVDYALELELKDSSGTAIDLSSSTVTSQIWDIARDTKQADFDVDDSNFSTGKIKLTLSDTDTQDISVDEGRYDVMVQDSSGSRSYYLRGAVFVEKGYSQPG